ncbi:hypothetical protein V5O48_012574 [Marasmius crinis-equi]|uniref:Uncharacterized protein n=1 Tax=Marasmius crinis-equi TaxID=585013 RepID=A0ABR3F2G6_9AGAR
MAPSPLYSRLLSLSKSHAQPKDATEIFAIRSGDAHHAWGHKYLVSRNPKLGDYMDNDAFRAHLQSTGRYLDFAGAELHDIVIDENQRKSVIRMSYFLTPKGSKETVENDLIWVLKFTDDEEVDKVLVKESVEFTDAAASGRLGTVIRELHGELEEDVRGGITLKEV